MEARTLDAIVAESRERGEQAGKVRASWVFDGNTSDATYLAFLRGNEDGDPAIMGQYDWSPLSGEWAGESMQELLGDLLDDAEAIDPDETDVEDARTEVADAYEEAATSAYWAELERVALYHTTSAEG